MANPNFILVNNKEFLSYEDIRKEFADLIELVTPNATVHEEWRTEFDAETGLRTISTLLYGQNTDSNIIHSWQIGVSAAPTERGDTNDFALIGGNKEFEKILNVDIWGFFDYAGLNGSWKVAEDETRLVQATVNANSSNFFKDSPKQKFFQKMFPFDMNSLDKEPFSDGTQVIISQNLVQVQIREILG